MPESRIKVCLEDSILRFGWVSLQNHASDGCREKISEGASDHCSYAECGQVVTPRRSQSANPAHLDGNGPKVGETTQRKRRNDERPRLQGSPDLAQHFESEKLIQHQTGAKQIAHLKRVLPAHSHGPGDRTKDEAENLLQVFRKMGSQNCHEARKRQ